MQNLEDLLWFRALSPHSPQVALHSTNPGLPVSTSGTWYNGNTSSEQNKRASAEDISWTSWTSVFHCFASDQPQSGPTDWMPIRGWSTLGVQLGHIFWVSSQRNTVNTVGDCLTMRTRGMFASKARSGSNLWHSRSHTNIDPNRILSNPELSPCGDTPVFPHSAPQPYQSADGQDSNTLR